MNMLTNVASVDWKNWPFVETAILTFIRGAGDHWLLIHKKQGLGKGNINAPGGRIEPGETAVQAAIRECQEEVGLTPHTLRESAELDIIFLDGYSVKVAVFIAEGYSGTMTETDEADPFWCCQSEIPYGRMSEANQYWLPRMFSGERVCGRFIFDNNELVSKEMLSLGEHLDCRQ